ncbi:MAG TPA: amidase family protein, partial [Candidatus Methanomethylicus sp.]|nr:amidase family protein [Candidatus Methanomethylicus sp.]
MMAGILDLTLYELVDAIKNGSLDAEEVLEEYKSSIRKSDGKVKAYITLNSHADGDPRGILAGAPIAVKDNICTKGMRTTCASKMLEGYVPPYDAAVVQSLAVQARWLRRR